MTGQHAPGEPRQIRHPGGKDGFWTVDCTAGDYSSGPYAYPGHAEQAAQAHAKAKNDNEREGAVMPFAMTSGRQVQVRSDEGQVIDEWITGANVGDSALSARGWTRIGEWFPNDEGSAALVMREREQ